MTARCVDRDQKIRFYRQRAFQKTIVRLVPDDGEFSKRITRMQTFDDAGQKIRLVLENLRGFLNHGRRRPKFHQASKAQFNYHRRWIHRSRQRGQLQSASVKNESQGRVWLAATPERDVSVPRIRSLPRRSLFFPYYACGTLPIPARAEIESAFHQLWLSRTWLKVTGFCWLRQVQDVSK